MRSDDMIRAMRKPRTIPHTVARFVAIAASWSVLALAGCGGDGTSAPSAAAPAATTAAVGAGGVTGQTPIAVRPTPGPCAATGTDAIPSPLLNSQLDCAP